MGERTIIKLPFAEGLTQQDAVEWADSGASASGVTNGNFTKAGAVDKRLGMSLLATTGDFLPEQGSPYVSAPETGVQAVSWSKCALGAVSLDAVGRAALYTMLDDGSGAIGLGPVPPPSVLRRPLPAADQSTTKNTTPSICDVPFGLNFRRFVFYASGSATWMLVVNPDGDLVNAPVKVFALAADVISAIYLPAAPSNSGVAVLLSFFVPGGPNFVVGLSVSTQGNSFSAAMASLACQTADFAPFVNDPSGGFIFAYQVAAGDWFWQYLSSAWSVVSNGTIEGIKAVTGQGLLISATRGTTEIIGFLYEYQLSGQSQIRFASISGDPSTLFATVTPAETIDGPLSGPYSDFPQAYLTGLCRISAGNLLSSWFFLQLPQQGPYGNSMPCGEYGIISAGGLYSKSGILPLGFYPTAKMFTVNGAPYQPALLQMSATGGNIAVGISEQCTLYLMQFAVEPGISTSVYCLPVATAAPRQCDPGVTNALIELPFPPPFCSATHSNVLTPNTRFAVGLKTQAEDQDGGQFAVVGGIVVGVQQNGGAWSVEYRFDAMAQSQQFQLQDVYGAGHLAAAVPMICDGVQVYEDSFFYYPEFAYAGTTGTGVAQMTGSPTWAVVYVHVDAVGQLSRGSPVFTNQFTIQPIYLFAAGAATVTQGSTSFSFAGTQPTLQAGTIILFDAQPDVPYVLDFTSSVNPYTLTTPYTGTSSTTFGVHIGGNAPAVYFPPLSATWRDLTADQGQVYAEIYRTVAAPGTNIQGDTFFLVTAVTAFPTNPASVGTVTGIVPTIGSGYTSVPGVLIAAPTVGVQATATAVLGGGQVKSVVVPIPGTYTNSGWEVTFTGGGGTGATGTANVGPVPGTLNSGVLSVSMTYGGTGYTSDPTAVFTAGAGSGASGYGVVDPIGVYSFNITNAGSGYTSPPLVTVSGGGGTGAGGIAIVATTDFPVQFIDNVTDSEISSNTILYTTGGVLDCVNPPGFSAQCVHWNRVWGVDDTRRVVWFTKAFTPGETPGYNEALTFNYPQDITGLWSMDDKLIIGTATGLAILYGQGPADNGQGSDLTLPQPITCDSGPVDWRAGVVFPGGFIFRSQTGFSLCDRSLNVTWIGKDVVDSLAAFPTVLSATMIPTATQVRFICQAASGATTALVYDYLVGKWLTHTYPQITSGVASVVLTGGTPEQPAGYGMLSLDGSFWQEHQPGDNNAYQDDDASGNPHFNPTTVTTAWTKLQGVQGYQRACKVQFFFEDEDSCGVTMAFAVNYDATIVQSFTWPSNIIDQLAIDVVQQHVAGAYNKQMALQVTLTDVASTTGGGEGFYQGRGIRFVALDLELEKLGDRFRQVPAIARS